MVRVEVPRPVLIFTHLESTRRVSERQDARGKENRASPLQRHCLPINLCSEGVLIYEIGSGMETSNNK